MVKKPEGVEKALDRLQLVQLADDDNGHKLDDSERYFSFVPFIMPYKVLILPSSNSLIIHEGNNNNNNNNNNYNKRNHYREGLEM